jgi:hypothetical protein
MLTPEERAHQLAARIAIMALAVRDEKDTPGYILQYETVYTQTEKVMVRTINGKTGMSGEICLAGTVAALETSRRCFLKGQYALSHGHALVAQALLSCWKSGRADSATTRKLHNTLKSVR